MNFQESPTILNSCTKKSGNLLNAPHVYIYVCMLNRIRLYESLRTKTIVNSNWKK